MREPGRLCERRRRPQSRLSLRRVTIMTTVPTGNVPPAKPPSEKWITGNRYQFLPEWRKHLRANIIAYTIMILVLASIGAFGTMLIDQNMYNYPLISGGFLNRGSAIQIGLISFLIGAAAGGLVIIMFIAMRVISDDLYEVLSINHIRGGILNFVLRNFLILIITSIIIFAIVWLYIRVQGESFGGDSYLAPVIKFLSENGGGIIGLPVAIITFVAFSITIQQLKDFQSRIVGTGDLIKRIVELSATSSSVDPLRMISFTPALGFLAQPLNEWQRVKNSLTDLDKDNRPKTQMIVLNETELKQWHGQFEGRRTWQGLIGSNHIKQAHEESMEIKRKLSSADINSYVETTYRDLPGFYCFFTSERAIISTPLFLPIFNTDVAIRGSIPSPHMIGYQTTDRATIDDLFHQFHYLQSMSCRVDGTAASGA
jgi:hypothetical protein